MTPASRLATTLGLVGLVALGGIGVWLESPGKHAPQQAATTISAPRTSPRIGQAVRIRQAAGSYAWSFGKGLPSQWTSRVHTSRDRHGTEVTTDKSAGYQLFSVALLLPIGIYEYKARFRMIRGGLAIGILNVPQQRFVQSQEYTVKTDGLKPLAVSGKFALRAQSSIAVVFSNAAGGVHSKWILQGTSLRRMKR
jgi:hypothetical protein